jgi:FkbM family methyltransferase
MKHADPLLCADPLARLLRPERLTAVVDIGANPIDGEPPYTPLLTRGLCTIVGFEPQAAALDVLKRRQGLRETYLPDVVGDGSPQTLHVCELPGMTSLLKPDPRTLALFPLFSQFGRVVATEATATRRLDDVSEVAVLDFLKIDVQGSELAVFRSGRQKLSQAVAVHTEVSFVPLYENQPTFGDVDRELREQGFLPHALSELKRWVIEPMRVNNNPRHGLNQLLEADLVYVRDFRRPEAFSAEQLKHLALIAHHCYRSFDLALYCLLELERRGRVAPGINPRYLEILNTASAAPATPTGG